MHHLTTQITKQKNHASRVENLHQYIEKNALKT